MTASASIVIQSSITAEAFYVKLGYAAIDDNYHGAERTIVMEHRLESGQ